MDPDQANIDALTPQPNGNAISVHLLNAGIMCPVPSSISPGKGQLRSVDGTITMVY